MKRKIKAKVLKKIKKKKVEHFCYFCGTNKRITRHHIIFRIFLEGQTLEDNIEYLCGKCHKKFHILVEPVINILVKTITKLMPIPARPIGFLRNGYSKGGKKNAKIHKKRID